MLAQAATVPRILGRYALYDPIASGGMATVHFGRLLGPVGFARTVAIKRLHGQFAQDPEFVSMFLDEARLAARIRHPNVVPTLDVVALDGELFLVMEYVQGEPLGALLKTCRVTRQRVPVPYAAGIISGALRGLHAAHEAKDEQGSALGIVHRDVSPQNILVGVDGVPRVLDFGVAKAAGRIQLTREGQIKGKIAYMPPEQIHGRECDRRTDVYAAGAVLWEALTGQKLYHGDSDVEVFAKVLEGNVPRPSELVGGISPDLDRVVMCALDKSPDARFPDAREMARVLESVVPLVSTAQIGEWVEATAAQHLTVRSQTVSRIEVDSSASVPQLLHMDTMPDGIPLSPMSSRMMAPPAPRSNIAGDASGISGISASGISSSAISSSAISSSAISSSGISSSGVSSSGVSASSVSGSSVVHSAVIERVDRRWVAVGAGTGLLFVALFVGIYLKATSTPEPAVTADFASSPPAAAAAPAATPDPVPTPTPPPPPPPPPPLPPAASSVAAQAPPPPPVATASPPTEIDQPPPPKPVSPPRQHRTHALDTVLDSRK